MNAVERLWNALVVILWTLATIGVADQDAYKLNMKQLYTCYLIGPSCKLLKYKNCTYTTNKLRDSNFYFSQKDFDSPNGANLLHLNKHLSLCRDTNSSFTCAYGKTKSELDLFCMKRTFPPPYIDDSLGSEDSDTNIDSTEIPEPGDGGDSIDIETTPESPDSEAHIDSKPDNGDNVSPIDPEPKPLPPPAQQPSPPVVSGQNCTCLPNLGLGEPADREIWVGTFVRYKRGMKLDLQQQCQPKYEFNTPPKNILPEDLDVNPGML